MRIKKKQLRRAKLRKNLAILAASALSWLEFTIQLSLFPCKQYFNIKTSSMTMKMIIKPDCDGLQTFNMILSEITLRGALVNFSGLPPAPPSSFGMNLL